MNQYTLNSTPAQTSKKIIKKRKAFDIPGFHESVKREFEAGEITLEEAAIEFYKANWTFYIDIKYTKEKLGL